MLKFKGSWEITRNVTRRKSDGKIYPNFDNSFPTVDEVYETIAPMTSDTVLQILHGQGIYWGSRYNSQLDKAGAQLPVYDAEKNNTSRGNAKPRWIEKYTDTRSERTKEERNAAFRAIQEQEKQAAKEAKQNKKLNKQFFKAFYSAMEQKEKRAVQLIAQINMIPLQQALDKYLDAIKSVEGR